MTELQKQDQTVITSPLCSEVYFSRHRMCVICVHLLWNLPEGQACDAYISTIQGVPRLSVYKPSVNVHKRGMHTFGRGANAAMAAVLHERPHCER